MGKKREHVEIQKKAEFGNKMDDIEDNNDEDVDDQIDNYDQINDNQHIINNSDDIAKSIPPLKVNLTKIKQKQEEYENGRVTVDDNQINQTTEQNQQNNDLILINSINHTSSNNSQLNATLSSLKSAQKSPIVVPIKMKKRNAKQHKKLNWAIVSDEDDDDDDDDEDSNPKPKKKRRGRIPKHKQKYKKPTFKVIENNKIQANDAATTTSPKQKSPRKKKDSKSSSSSSSSSTSGFDNALKTISKSEGAYQFKCLIKPIDFDLKIKLPPEICTKIFNIILEENNSVQELIKLSQVCESWREIIISTPLLWKSLNLANYPDYQTEQGGLYNLCDSRLFTNVNELNLTNWNGTAAQRVLSRIVMESNHNLKSIILKNCKYISHNFLQTISTHCTSLDSLDISGITSLYFSGYYHHRKRTTQSQNGAHSSPSTNIFSAQLWKPFLENCGHNLTTLILAENSMPTFSNCLSAIMDYCQNLQVLDLCNVESISKSSTIPIQKLQVSCPNLRVLRAANITLTVSSSLSSPGFVNLEELSIPLSDSGMVGVITTTHTDAVIEQLTKSSEKLKLLDIRGSRLITPRALVKIPAWNIQLLSLSNCPRLYTDQLGLAFSKWSSSLIDVDLSWNVNENSVVSCLRSLCEAGDDSQLKSIQLRGSAVPYEYLKKLLKICTKLESIDLQSCRGLPRGIKRTFSGQEFKLLREEVMLGKYD